MGRLVRAGLLTALVACGAAGLGAQQGGGFRLEESTFNNGGHPAGAPTGGGFRIAPGSIGDTVSAPSVVGGFSLLGGFSGAYPPPLEVLGVRFDGPTAMAWEPERSVGRYGVYEGTLTSPFDAAFGACLLTTDPTIPAATIPTPVSPGQTLFYLVTARNRLGEEGTKGKDRPTPAPCPGP